MCLGALGCVIWLTWGVVRQILQNKYPPSKKAPLCEAFSWHGKQVSLG